MEVNDRVNPSAPEGVAGQPLRAGPEQNGEARTSEPAPEAAAPRFRDYYQLTGRGVPGLPCIRQSTEPTRRDYSALTGRI